MTTINTWAGTAGRITGSAWRTLVWIESEINWAEVGHIVWHGLLAFTVGVYVAGEFTGRWVHRTSARLARLWVQLLVLGAAASSQRQTGVKFEVPLLPAAPAPVALLAPQPIETVEGHLDWFMHRHAQDFRALADDPAPVIVQRFAIAAVPARCGIRRLAAEVATTSVAPPAGWLHISDPMARAIRMVRNDGRSQRLAASLCGVSRSSLQRALKAA